MTTLHLIWLAAIQGLTEFLPVSSSGHLILFANFSPFPDQGIGMDIALHIGSLAAVLIYFHKTIGAMLSGLWQSKFLPNFQISGSRLAYLLLVASIPALVIGFILRNEGMEIFRSPKLIGWTILIYGLLLWIADKYGKMEREMTDLNFKDALFIGLAQCLALIPGTSRSGITITMARFLGIQRTEAAKFSMLLSIPTILAAGMLESWRMFHRGNIAQIWSAADAAFYSFLASMIVIYAMLKWLKKSSYLPFVIYRIFLGIALIVYSYHLF